MIYNDSYMHYMEFQEVWGPNVKDIQKLDLILSSLSSCGLDSFDVLRVFVLDETNVVCIKLVKVCIYVGKVPI